MANYFVNLPAPQVPRNALMDFAPINNALDGIQHQNNVDRQRGDMLEQRDYQRGREAKVDQRQLVADLGKQAHAASMLTDPAQQQAALAKIIAQHPAPDSLGPEYRTPATGLKLIASEAGLFRDPMEEQAKSLQIQKGRADLSMAPLQREKMTAEIEALRQKQNDPVAAMLLQRLAPKPQPQAAPQRQPMLQPQSFDGGDVMPGGVTPINDPQTAPGSPPTADAAQGMVMTPFGEMTVDEARQLGGAMLLKPQYQAAGKAILDSIKSEGEGGLAKPTINQLEEKTVSAASTLGRLQNIRQQFKPEFQNIPNKLKLYGASWGAAFGGKLPPDMQKNLGEFAQFKAAAFDNFNQLLKELSGTAVSAQELQRQKIVQPNPGEGLFDGDDPVTFMSKIDQGEKLARSAMARMNFMRSKGLQFNRDTAERFMRLEDVPAVIDKRGAEIEQQLRQANPKADPMSIERETAKRLKQEFGI